MLGYCCLLNHMMNRGERSTQQYSWKSGNALMHLCTYSDIVFEHFPSLLLVLWQFAWGVLILQYRGALLLEDPKTTEAVEY